MARDYQHFTFEKAGEVATITLNRPDKLNAFNIEMLYEFGDIVDVLRLDSEDPVRDYHRGGPCVLRWHRRDETGSGRVV